MSDLGIPKREFLLGGMNLHEDLHFSSFYLGASLREATLPAYPGYSIILASYEDAVEHYYVLAHEAEATAQYLIRRFVADRALLARVLKSIEDCSYQLRSAFPIQVFEPVFSHTAVGQLLRIYRRHNRLHRELYRVARVPEALDRGKSFFTDYLRDCLRSCGVGEGDLNRVFQAMTKPSIPSLVAEEEKGALDLMEKIQRECPEALTAHYPAMFFAPGLRSEVWKHCDRWRWLSYHGYRSRTLPDEHEYIQRLARMSEVGMSRLSAQTQPSEDRDDAAAIAEKLDGPHRELFRLYPEIGRVKLERRFAQLRNFYYLDRLLAEFAKRLGVSEWEVRCCFPWELEAALERGFLGDVAAKRLKQCVVIYRRGSAEVFVGEERRVALQSVATRRKRRSAGTRKGTPACMGYARGRARIVGRSIGSYQSFEPGEILICEAADPDLLPLIRRAAAVVSQQGGVTSHAAVLCRELGIPTVVGINDVFGFLQGGEEIEVDANTGQVRRLEAELRLGQVSLLVPSICWERADCVGRKAASLTRGLRLGFRIPRFALVDFARVQSLLGKDDKALRDEFREVVASLGQEDGTIPSVLLRSSAQDEDSNADTKAGKYFSVRVAESADPLEALREFVERNSRRGYSGVIIVQRWLEADFCGVSIDGDPRMIGRGKLVVEYVFGSSNLVTGGMDHPSRLVYDHDFDEIVSDTVGRSEGNCRRPSPALRSIISWLKSVGDAFGRPTYTEWGHKDGNFWLYQVRGGEPD